MNIFKIGTAKRLIKAFKQLKKRQAEVLARHNELHPDVAGHGREFAEYQATWCEYCNLRDELYNIKSQYKQL